MRFLLISLAAVGLGLGGLLLSWHLEEGETGTGLVASLCGGGSDCDSVLRSRWAYIPPSEKAIEEGKAVPVALAGMAYFAGFLIWFLGMGVGSPAKPWSWVPLCAGGIGALASLGFVGIMLFVLGHVCPWCLAVHGTNLAMVGALFVSRSPAFQGRIENSPARAERFTGFPRTGAVVVFSLLAWALIFQTYRASRADRERERLETALQSLQEDASAIQLAFYGQERQEIPVREGEVGADPTIEAAEGYRNTLVIFGDAECSACRRFHTFLDEVVRPAYQVHLRIVFKHFPLTSHPHAMRAALALEAAREQHRFWPMLEALYHRQYDLERIDFVAVARSLGMDAEQFARDFASPSIRERVEEDRRLGERLGIEGTPSIFLNGRPVKSSIRNLASFWRAQADELRNYREAKGQGWGIEGIASQ